MCGIAGFCDFQENFPLEQDRWSAVLGRMRGSIAHRGHDQTGDYLAGPVGLAHTRLSIRDLTGGVQPMARRRDGSDYVIVYNGEVYNTDELVPPLEAAGYRFETTGDTEAILYAYMEYGLSFAEKLNGIFALAIWDGREKRLVLCRDRLGVKPLFYAPVGGTLVFGSEIKALFQHPHVQPRVNEDSFREIFGLGPSRTPGCGVFQGVHELRPGEMALYDCDGLRFQTYWRLRAAPHMESYAETVERVSFLVRDAIRRQMVSDVPVCSFLSGGIDSSIVTAVAAQVMTEAGETLDTFSFDFAGNGENFHTNAFQPTQDEPFVALMTERCPVRHTHLVCDEALLPDLLYASVAAKDLPGMTDVDASLQYFCGLVRRHERVALTGECADEIFGGYPWFYRPELLYSDGFPWMPDLAARTFPLSDDTQKALQLEDYVRFRYEQSLAETPHLEGESGEARRRREVSWLNLRWFMQTLLDRMDRSSMAWGLEARVPFADHRIVEYLYNVPWEMKYRDGLEKALLRDACQDLLPPEILWRKKSPYPKTYDPRYEAALATRLRTVLDDRAAPINRFLSRERVERFLLSPKDYGRPWFGQLMAGPQMIAYLLQVNEWMRRFALG